MGGTYSIQNETAYNWYYKSKSDTYQRLPSGALETKGVTKRIWLKYEDHNNYDLKCDYGGYEYRIIEKKHSKEFELLCGSKEHRHVCKHFDEIEKSLQRERREREQRERQEREQRERQEREQRERQEREQRERREREQRERREREQRERREREQRERQEREQREREQRERREREQRERLEREQREREQRERREREQQERREREQREREQREREQRERQEREQRERREREQREREQREREQRERREREQQERREREQRERQERERREREQQEREREREQRERQEREQQERLEREQRERMEREERERQEQWRQERRAREQETQEQLRHEYESRQDFRGKTTHLTAQHQFQSKNTGEEWNELWEVEEEFHELFTEFNIIEDEHMQVSTLEDRMAALFVGLIDKYLGGDHRSFSSLVTIEQKIGFQDMSLSKKLIVLKAMLQQTPDTSYNDLVPHLKGREGGFVLSLLEKLQNENPDMAVGILHSFTECLTTESSETLGYILYNGIWTPVEVMKFLQRVENSTADHIQDILEIALWNGLSGSSVLSALHETDPIDYLMKDVERENDKDLNTLISEMRENDYPENALSTIYSVLSKVQHKLSAITSPETFDLAKTKEILQEITFADPDIPLLQELLISMCLAVRKFTRVEAQGDFPTHETMRLNTWFPNLLKRFRHTEAQGYFPRLTQLASLLTLLLPQSRSDKGCVLQVATGEGKTCIVAMFAAIQAMHGMKPDIMKPDIITSSPVLASRDQQKWQKFYDMFGLTSSVVPPEVTSDNYEELVRKAYDKDIVYGTMETFAADTLRQEFEGQTTRGKRPFDMAIVDEVDFMTLDHGMQVTFLSHDTSILRHMEQILAGMWAVLSACRPIEIKETGEMQWTTRPQVLHKTIESALNVEADTMALNILQLAVELGFCTQGDMNAFIQADSGSEVQDDNQDFRDRKWKALENIMSRIGPDEQYKLLKKFEERMEEDMPIECFSFKDNKAERYGDTPMRNEGIKLLFLANGFAYQIIPEDELITGAVENLTSKITFSHKCDPTEIHKLTDCLMVPSFLKQYSEDQLPVFAESALRAIVMVEGREYMIEKAQEADSKGDNEKESHQFDSIIPVDYISSGILQKNSKWGDGLQQFLEMKHQLAISPLSTVTNYMSNIHYLQRYVKEKGIFGVTGTLGGDAEKDFLSRRYQSSSYVIPTHRHKKLVEVPAIIVKGGEMQWNRKICEVTMKAAKRGHTVLIICEDVKTAHNLNKQMKTQTESISLYTISGRHDIEEKTFGIGDIIIATNLAGRGTDVQVQPDVNTEGGLFVILTHFPTSERVEQQAFGRTARKGNPGMVQMVLNNERLDPVYKGQTIHTMRQRRSQREMEKIKQMEADQLHVIDRKDHLFSIFCALLTKFRNQYTAEEKMSFQDMKNVPDCFKSYRPRFDYHPAVNALKESWAFWLSHNEDRIGQAKTYSEIEELKKALRTLLLRKIENLKQGKSHNFHDYIKQAENRTDLHRWHKGESFGAGKYWERAAECDQVYSAIALYNQAYVTINLRQSGYMSKAEELLKKANDLVDVFLTETTNTMSFCHLSVTGDFKPHSERSNFSMQMEARMNIFKSWKGYINQALEKLEKLSNNKDHAVTEVSTVYRLLDDKDFIASNELRTMDKYGLGIVFEVKQKPKFSYDSLICFLLGTLQVVAGILMCVLTVGGATNFGMSFISEGVSDMIAGVKGMATGTFSWTQWAISKSISIGVSLMCGAFKLVKKCGLSAERISQSIRRGAGNVFTSATSTTTLTMKETAKQAFKYSAQEVVKQGALAGISYGIDKGLETSFKNIFRKGFYNKVGSLINQNDHLRTAVRLYICREYPKEWIEKGTYPKREEDISKSIQSMTTTITPQLLTNLSNAHEVISILSQAVNTAMGQLEGSTAVSALSTILNVSGNVTTIIEILRNLPTPKIIEDFVTLLLTKISEGYEMDFSKEEKTIKNKQVLSVIEKLLDKIMHEIAKNVSETFVDKFAERATTIGSRFITKKVSEKVGEAVGNILGRHNTTAFFENQMMNHDLRVASKTPTESLTQTMQVELQSYAERQSSTDRPATGADIHILTMCPLLEGKGIHVIVTDERGKPYYEERYQGSQRSDEYIKLRLVKSEDQSQQQNGLGSSLKSRIRGECQPYTGHFMVVNANGTTSPVHSEGQDCLYHAVVQATSNGQRDINELRKAARQLRNDVTQKVQQNPKKYYGVVSLHKRFEENFRNPGRYTICGGSASGHRKKKLGEVSGTRDMVKTLQMSFTAAHPEKLGSLRNNKGRSANNTMPNDCHFKTGVRQLVDKYEKGCIDNNMKDKHH